MWFMPLRIDINLFRIHLQAPYTRCFARAQGSKINKFLPSRGLTTKGLWVLWRRWTLTHTIMRMKNRSPFRGEMVFERLCRGGEISSDSLKGVLEVFQGLRRWQHSCLKQHGICRDLQEWYFDFRLIKRCRNAKNITLGRNFEETIGV